MKTYIYDWKHGKPGGERNEDAVNEFVRKIQDNWSLSPS